MAGAYPHHRRSLADDSNTGSLRLEEMHGSLDVEQQVFRGGKDPGQSTHRSLWDTERPSRSDVKGPGAEPDRSAAAQAGGLHADPFLYGGTNADGGALSRAGRSQGQTQRTHQEGPGLRRPLREGRNHAQPSSDELLARLAHRAHPEDGP